MNNIEKAPYKKNLCKMCKAQPPAYDVLWDNGHKRAWFCVVCYPKWQRQYDRNIVRVGRINEGEAAAKRTKVRQVPMAKQFMIDGKIARLEDMAQAWLEKQAASIDFELTVEIAKKDGLKQIVYGVPLRVGKVDSQGHTISIDEVEAGAHSFMIDSQRYDHNHERLISTQNAQVVESYLAPVDFEMGGQMVRKGDWVLATKIFDKNLWSDIESGKLKGYSIKGRGQVSPVKQLDNPL